MDTSVPRQRGASDSALVDMLMLEAPVGLALFGRDLRFRWVNAALTRLGLTQAGLTRPGGQAGADPSGPPDPSMPPGPDPSGPLGWAGLLPSEAWPEPIATRAEKALRKVLAEGVPLAEPGYPAVSPLAAAPLAAADAAPADAAPADAAPADAAPADAAPVNPLAPVNAAANPPAAGAPAAGAARDTGVGQSGEEAGV
ncbi:MAG: hypothetical protein ACRDOH_05810, partial [Streptosporangiaceae bacterium]